MIIRRSATIREGSSSHSPGFGKKLRAVSVSSSPVEQQFESAERDKKRLDRSIIYWICVFILCIF